MKNINNVEIEKKAIRNYKDYCNKNNLIYEQPADITINESDSEGFVDVVLSNTNGELYKSRVKI